jgi:hypothetical protein
LHPSFHLVGAAPDLSDFVRRSQNLSLLFRMLRKSFGRGSGPGTVSAVSLSYSTEAREYRTNFERSCDVKQAAIICVELNPKRQLF